MNSLSIYVENIKCGGCAGSIKSRLLEEPNISEVHIDIESGNIEMNGSNLNEVVLMEKLHHMGYPPAGSENGIITRAKSYISCATGKLLHS